MASKFQSKVIKEMESKGYTVLKIIRLSVSGYPDLQCLRMGRVVWIECKEAKDELKPLQAMRINELINNGFEAYCLHETKGKIYP